MSTPFQQRSNQESIDKLKALESQIEQELNTALGGDPEYRKLQDLLRKTKLRRLQLECHSEGVSL